MSAPPESTNTPGSNPQNLPATPFVYQTLEEAPSTHREIVRLRAHFPDTSQEEIASVVGVDHSVVSRALSHPPLLAEVERLRMNRTLQLLAHAESFDDLVDMGIRAIEDVLKSKRASATAKLKAAELVMDRHPSGKYIKRTKREVTRTDVIDTKSVDVIKRRALELQQQEDNVLDAEFTVVQGVRDEDQETDSNQQEDRENE